MPAARVSFHIGVRTYDPEVYANTAPDLNSPERDTRDLYNLARSFGFRDLDLQDPGEWIAGNPAPPNVKIDGDATYQAVVDLFGKAAGVAVNNGDSCFITFSCHGLQIKETGPAQPDEPDLHDEGVCLFDFVMVDDVLAGLLHGFKKDVNVFLMLDCCHSGPSAEQDDGGVLESFKLIAVRAFAHLRNAFFPPKPSPQPSRPISLPGFGIAKSAPMPAGDAPPIAGDLQKTFKGAAKKQPDANVAVFSACRDTENTFDGENPGDLSLYARKFLEAVGDGSKKVSAIALDIEGVHPKIATCNPKFRHHGATILQAYLKQ